MNTEEVRIARLENDAAIKRLRLPMKMNKKSKTGEDGSYTAKTNEYSNPFSWGQNT